MEYIRRNWPSFLLRALLSFYLSLGGACVKCIATDTSKTDMILLLGELFRSYSANEIPPRIDEKPVKIQLGIAVNQIIDLDERNQIFFSNIWRRLYWQDSRLNWDSGNYSGINELHLTTSNIWTPDVVLYSDVREQERDYSHIHVKVNSSGDVSWFSPIIYKSYCKLDVTFFPYDQQMCVLKFGSWGYHGLELDLVNETESGDTTSYVGNGEWELIGIPLRRHVKYYGCCVEPYPDVTFYVIIRRRPQFYFFNIILPSILISSVTLLSFCLPSESGEKVSLVVTVLLALTVFLLLITEIMPPQSDVIPLIAIYFFCDIVLLSASTVVTVLVVKMRYSGSHGAQVPLWLKKVAFQWLARPLGLSAVTELNLRSHNTARVQPMTENYNMSKKKTVSDTPEEGKINGVTTFSDSPSTSFNAKLDTAEEGLRELMKAQTQTNELLHLILQKMNLFEDIHQSRKRNDKRCMEWRLLVLIADRLFLIVFLIFTLIMNVCILLHRPQYEQLGPD